jgi:U32 family peptidase
MPTPNPSHTKTTGPLILAPAGNRASFLAALAAGADAVYCGLKSYSARAEAKNFTIPELAALTELAHRKRMRVHTAFNAMLTAEDLPRAAGLLQDLVLTVRPDALIVQDLAMIDLARQKGFTGEIHLSTLANAGFAGSLDWIRRHLAVDQVVVPRELDIDEIRAMAAACPDGLGLEVFIHGALCYSVSGRCYWSSFLGGKSGLRGRCVQPCRRQYQQRNRPQRHFSCMDLSHDVLVKVLRTIPEVKTWKIEGRKKGPHYVYHTVMAYRMLRDEGHDPQRKREALQLLEQSLGRPTTHYRFLPQRPQIPLQPETPTGSGLLVGIVKGTAQNPYISPRQPLLAGDVLRVGYEDDAGHTIVRVRKPIVRNGRLNFKPGRRGGGGRQMPVFLTDRREPELNRVLEDLETELRSIPEPRASHQPNDVRMPAAVRFKKGPARDMVVTRAVTRSGGRGAKGLWVSPQTVQKTAPKAMSSAWWWLSPVLWPASETETAHLIARLLKGGARQFVLNAPWQAGFFERPEDLQLWAGPFCNLANPLALAALKQAGFSGAFVSPELGREAFLELSRLSPLPLGVVLTGMWPLCMSRVISDTIDTRHPFASPRGEEAWARRYDDNIWIFPNWPIDLSEQRQPLEKAGYQWLVHLQEPVPKTVKLKPRQGLWNWNIGLK